jgi:uncharacterized protein (DUF885 family)
MMRKSVYISLILLLSAAGLFLAANMSDDEKFQQLVDQYLEARWHDSPLQATFTGIHKYDDQVGSLSVASAKTRYQNNKQFADRISREIDASKLNESNAIDYKLIQEEIDEEGFSLNQSHDLERDPSIYAQVIAGTGFIMFSRDFAPLPERMKNLTARMEKFPQLLEEGKKNLTNPPKLWTNIAAETTKGAIGLYQQLIGPAVAQVPGEEDLKKRFAAANKNLLAALTSYEEFLEKDLTARSTGDFKDGRDHFVYRLKNFYLIDQTPEEIKAIAQKVLEQSEADMAAEARQVDANKKWWEILDDAKKKHWPSEQVLPEYSKCTERARQWVIDQKIATIPEEKLQVIETPLFMRFVVPYAAYFSPAPFEKEQKGFYFVTPLDKSLPKEQQEGKLGELYIDVENTTLHEGYPGHHLQFIHQFRLSKIRRLSTTSIMSEGWGLYCERLGEEFKFYSTPIDSMQAYRWLIVRAVRVLVDVGLHVDGMTYDQAVKMMLDHAKLERPGAEGEVRRYTQSPTQPLSYLMGMRMIRDLRDHVQRAQGDKFSLQDFHDHLLDYGSIPPKMIQESMMKDLK